MFCTKCGAQNPDGGKNCSSCGAPLGTVNAAGKKPGVDLGELWRRLRAMKYFLPGIIGAAGVILLILAAVILDGARDKKAEEENRARILPIENYLNSRAKADGKKFMAAFPKEVTEDLDENGIEYVLGGWLDDLEDVYGRNIKISFKVTDEDNASKKELKDFREYLENEYGLNGDKVSEVWTITAAVTVKGSQGKETNEGSYTVFQYKGKWYLDPMYTRSIK